MKEIVDNKLLIQNPDCIVAMKRQIKPSKLGFELWDVLARPGVGQKLKPVHNVFGSWVKQYFHPGFVKYCKAHRGNYHDLPPRKPPKEKEEEGKANSSEPKVSTASLFDQILYKEDPTKRGKLLYKIDVVGPTREIGGAKEYLPEGKRYIYANENRNGPNMVNISGKTDITCKTKYHLGEPFLAKDQSSPKHIAYLKSAPYLGDIANSRDSSTVLYSVETQPWDKIDNRYPNWHTKDWDEFLRFLFGDRYAAPMKKYAFHHPSNIYKLNEKHLLDRMCQCHMLDSVEELVPVVCFVRWSKIVSSPC